MTKPLPLTAIAKALANDEFEFYYQPIISMFTGKICGAESLIRWRQPDGTIIPPGEFIPLAEETGFITKITEQMLPKVVQGLATLNQLDDSLIVSFNVSAKDFANPEFLGNLARATEGRLPRLENFCIEITETAFLPSDGTTQRVLHAIDEQGISIILNDFSAGHTTFPMLTELPLKAIKVAMNITQKAPTSRMDFRLFRHLVSIAHQLHLTIIAEGVEDLETHSLILSTGCTHTQGYYYGRPMPLPNFTALLDQKPGWSEYPFGLEYLAQFDHIDFRRDVIRASYMISSNPEKEIQDRALARLPELDPDECLFGKWYNNVRDLNDGNLIYARIGAEHRLLHETANTLLTKASAGSSWAELGSLVVEFSNRSKTIMDLIQDLEIQKLTDYFFP